LAATPDPDGRELVTLDLDADTRVAVVRLDDPDNRNALRYALVRALADRVAEALDRGAEAIVLTATPPVFCAGGSPEELLEPRAPLRDLYAGYLALAEAPVVTIAAVNGPAIGAGVNLALACDVILASPSARFDPRFLDLGIHPGGGHLWRLRDRVGRQAAAALSLCGESVDGETAARIGLAWACHPHQALLPAAMRMARRAAGRPAATVRRAKTVLDASPGIDDPARAFEVELEAQAWSMTTPEFRARVADMRRQLGGR
jgi:enoyl-CoA hydratase